MELSWDSILPSESRNLQVALIVENGATAGAVAAKRAIEALGFNFSRELEIDLAHSWVNDNAHTDGVIVEVNNVLPATLTLLPKLNAFATRNNVPVFVTAPIEAIDTVHAAISGEKSYLLCKPTIEERIATMATEVVAQPQMLHDISTEMDTMRLRRLADEVSRIARALSNLSATERPNGGYAAQVVSDVQIGFRAEPITETVAPDMPTSEEVRKILRLRRLRDQFFDPSLFADPAWDMLLDLLAARIERAQVAVSSLCIAAAVPPTTALRWIKAMSDHGLFERCADPDDGRRIFIQLSDKAIAGMGHYFAAMRRLTGTII